MTSLERIQAIENHLSRMTKDTNGAYFEPDGTHVPMAGDVAFLVEAFGKMREIALQTYICGDELNPDFEEAMSKVMEAKR